MHLAACDLEWQGSLLHLILNPDLLQTQDAQGRLLELLLWNLSEGYFQYCFQNQECNGLDLVTEEAKNVCIVYNVHGHQGLG